MNAAHRTKDYILEHGWTKGAFEREDGSVCLMGAVDHVVCSLEEKSDLVGEMFNVMREQYPNDPRFFSMVGFNDTAEITKDDVIALLEKTAVRLDEAV